MKINYQERHNVHPVDAQQYDTERMRKEFLFQDIFGSDAVNLVYSYIDRFIVGGIMPIKEPIALDTIDPLKAEYFLERRELGLINIGGNAKITADSDTFEVGHKEALYLGKGTRTVQFETLDKNQPAKLYFNSATAHTTFPNRLITKKEGNVLEVGAQETSNERKIYQLLVNNIIETCQLQMGLTELMPGSVWNTMPVHTHSRRNEVYFYFNIAEGQALCHIMGEPDETRHIWIQNEQAVLSPSWSIHCGAGTTNYSFIWGMAGENLDYGDMDVRNPDQLR